MRIVCRLGACAGVHDRTRRGGGIPADRIGRILQRLESEIAVESRPGYTESRVLLPIAR